jgi:hypothetical protein
LLGKGAREREPAQALSAKNNTKKGQIKTPSARPKTIPDQPRPIRHIEKRRKWFTKQKNKKEKNV